MLEQIEIDTGEIKEKAKKVGAALGAIGVLGAGGSLLLVEGYAAAHSAPQGHTETPIERTMDKYPGVINQAPMAGDEQIATAGEWKAQHPEVNKIVIEEVTEHYGHDPQGNAAEQADSKVSVKFSNGKTVVMPGFGEVSYNGTNIPSLNKKLTHLSEKIGIEGGNQVTANGAENQAVLDALNSAVSTPDLGQ